MGWIIFKITTFFMVLSSLVRSEGRSKSMNMKRKGKVNERILGKKIKLTHSFQQ